MAWQPMPPPATDPSGTSVEVLCGQPEQKYGVRVAPGTSISRAAGGSSACARAGKSISGKNAWSRRATIGASRRGLSSPIQGTRSAPVSSVLPTMRSGLEPGTS